MLNKIITQKIKIIIGGFLLLGILSGASGVSPVFAEAKQSTLTLSASTDSLTVELTPEAAGSFGKSDAATIRVRTDNFTGYTLGVFTDGNTDLIGNTGGTINSITSAVTEEAFSTSGDYNNKWGYRPSKIVSGNGGNQVVNDNTSFLPVPGVLGDTIDITTASNSVDNTYTLDFGARANYDTIPGTYTNSLTIVALANNIVYNINYDKNTTDTVTDMPSPNPQVVTIDGGTPVAQSIATLSDAVPTRDGYQFEGWCDVATTLDTNTGSQTCSGNTYVAGADYGIDQTEDGSNIRLYAVWSKINMQNITLEELDVAMPDEGDSITITDGRNGNDYEITRINDQYWMTTNLAIGGNTEIVLTNENTNLNGRLTSYILPASSSDGFDDPAAESVYNAGAEEECSSTQPCYGYYSFAAATAGTNPNSGSAVSDICPKGWRLPTSAELNTLWNSYGSNLDQDPFRGSFAGYYNNSSFENGGAIGGYWSSAALNSSDAVYLGFDGSNSSVINEGKNYGYSVRCVKKVENVHYEVEFNQGDCYTGGSAGSLYTTVTYGSNVLADIVEPTCNGLTNTNSVTDFNTSHNNASGATVTFQSSGNCTAANSCSSSRLISFAFNGWHDGSSAGPLVASAGTTPFLQASVSGYTNAAGLWTRTSGATLYAGWTTNIGSYSQVTLPTITKNGYTCKWQNTGDSNVFYESGASIVPGGNMGVQGYCLANMQSISKSQLSTTIPDEMDRTTLVDSRDGNEYTVTHIGDIYMMTTNLSLGGSAAMTLTSTDTNLNGSVNSYTLPASSQSGFNDPAAENIYNAGQRSCSSNQSCYGYYTFMAATAGTGGTGTVSPDDSSDICPKGWRLAGQTLLDAISYRVHSAGLDLSDEEFFNGTLAGYYSNGSLSDGGSAGYIWASNDNLDGTAAALTFEDGTGGQMESLSKSRGQGIRCIKKQDVPIMQDVTSSDLNALIPNDGDKATLEDARDNKKI